MAKLVFERHGKIQEWVAEELGFFKDLRLDYAIADQRAITADGPGSKGISGKPEGGASAFLDFVRSSAKANLVATSHWAVAAAIGAGHGRLWPNTYSIMPAGIYIQPGLSIASLADLANLEIVVGRHSGSHFAALHALDGMIPAGQLKLKFVAGRGTRLQSLLENAAPAGSIYAPESYILEQRGFQKVMDTSFMVSFMTVGDPPINDVAAYFEVLQRAQRAIDEEPKRYKHYLLRELAQEARPLLDVNRSGIGERLIFDQYSEALLARTQAWVKSSGILAGIA